MRLKESLIRFLKLLCLIISVIKPGYNLINMFMQRIVNIQYLHNDNDTNIITNGYTIRKLHVIKNG